MSKAYMVEFKKLFDICLENGFSTVDARAYCELELKRIGIKKY
jgi:hypothetical protein